MLKPALNTTDEPPVTIQNILLLEYVHELRRRIEIQNIQMTELSQQIQQLTQAVRFYQEQQLQEMP